MKKLLNTLYITSENAYLSLDGENVVITVEKQQLGRLPLHTLESILTFGYVGASPALMGKCAEMNVALVFLKPSGKFLAKVTGKAYGNILLRREQYRVCEDQEKSLLLSKNIISAKIKNQATVVNRTLRDHEMRVDNEKFTHASEMLKDLSKKALLTDSAESLRGIEGEAANIYFSVFDDMILQQKDDFFFKTRNRRPPMDNVNAMLSFIYSLLTSQCVSALEAVGLDPYSGFFHTLRPGRCSLALDIVEEFRACFADRFVLSLINKKVISDNDFCEKEGGGILFKDEGRKKAITHFQERKKEIIVHPFINEKIEWGLIPYVQAMLLAKHLRGDIDDYPPFYWK